MEMGPPCIVTTYIPSDAPWYKEHEYVQLWGGKFINFKDIKLVPYCAPPDRRGMTLTNLCLYYVWKLLYKFEPYMVIGACWDVPFISTCKKKFPLLWSHPTPLGHDFNKLDFVLFRAATIHKCFDSVRFRFTPFDSIIFDLIHSLAVFV
jgi:hypothetical protein